MSTIAGTWKTELKTPMGVQLATMTITEDPAAVTITEASQEEIPPVSDVAVDGDTATFTMAVTKPMKLKVAWVLTADGDSLTGTAKAGMFPTQKVTGQRA